MVIVRSIAIPPVSWLEPIVGDDDEISLMTTSRFLHLLTNCFLLVVRDRSRIRPLGQLGLTSLRKQVQASLACECEVDQPACPLPQSAMDAVTLLHPRSH